MTDGGEGNELAALEKVLLDESADPVDLPFSLLKAITGNFSEDNKIGRGGFGAVYKGVLPSGHTIAVKKLFEQFDILDKNFACEIACLVGVKHKNTVRFLGYCSETQHVMRLYEGRSVWADVRQRLLCFEYLPKGCLADYLSDASCRLQWTTCYQIIKGICEGVHYLHQQRIIHMDLKPQNVLLDNNIVPRIADFGLSRLLSGSQSRAITDHKLGTMGYMAPEFLNNGEITFKTDIYSLGVIIMKILMGHKESSSVKEILDTWRNRLQISEGHIEKLEQIRVCAELGIQCAQLNPVQRPVTQHIIDRLDEVKDRSIKTGTFAVEQVSLQVGHSSTPVAIVSSISSEHDEVSELLQKLSSQNVLDQREAAGVLRQLVKSSAEHRACIGESGGIPILARLLSSTTDLSTQEHVVTTLLIISVNRENRRRIVSSGGVAGIVRAVERGNMSPLALLSILSNGPEGVAAITAAAAVIPSLVGVIRNGSPASKGNAVAILLRLSDGEGKQQRQNLAQAHEHGLVPLLAELKESSSTHRGESKATRLLRLMNN